MEFKKYSRDANLLLSGQWRLASVNEVKNNFEEIKKKGILGKWDIVRLLDGWVDGEGYGYKLVQGFKTGNGEMLLVKTKVSRPPDGSFVPEMYSGVELNAEGRKAALLLSNEDKITEVIFFVLYLFTKVEEREAQLHCSIRKIKEVLGCPCKG